MKWFWKLSLWPFRHRGSLNWQPSQPGLFSQVHSLCIPFISVSRNKMGLLGWLLRIELSHSIRRPFQWVKQLIQLGLIVWSSELSDGQLCLLDREDSALDTLTLKEGPYWHSPHKNQHKWDYGENICHSSIPTSPAEWTESVEGQTVSLRGLLLRVLGHSSSTQKLKVSCHICES